MASAAFRSAFVALHSRCACGRFFRTKCPYDTLLKAMLVRVPTGYRVGGVLEGHRDNIPDDATRPTTWIRRDDDYDDDVSCGCRSATNSDWSDEETASNLCRKVLAVTSRASPSTAAFNANSTACEAQIRGHMRFLDQ
jgi:hypothetical protein